MSKALKFNDINTPCYIINTKRFKENIECVRKAFILAWGKNISVAYSIKTNHFPYLLMKSIALGCMAEAVSSDEYLLAIKLGIKPSRIIYNGPQRKDDTFLYAIKNGSIINIDNFEDIALLKAHKKQLNPKSCRIGIRVNFDLENTCKGETTAGDQVSRFGICVENGDFTRAVEQIQSLGFCVEGLHMHYSTKTRSLSVFNALASMAANLVKDYNLEENLTFIDIGGGFFGGQKVEGYPSMDEYASVISDALSKIPRDRVRLIVEPGASILSTAVEYVCRVINKRDVRGTRVVTVDGSLLHINPFLRKRQPSFDIESDNDKLMDTQLVCGCTCMENDRIIQLDNKTVLSKGDLLRIHNVGAYTMSFNSCFINVPPYIYEYDEDRYVLLRDKDYNMMLKI